MSIWAGLWVALDSLVANKLRSFLTMLGIIIGVAAVLVVIAIGEGLKTDMLKRIESLGTNLLSVYPGAGQRFGPTTRPGRLTEEDWKALETDLAGAATVAPALTGGVTSKYRNLTHSTRVLGTTSPWPHVQSFEIVAGRFFGPAEERARARVAVLGNAVVDELFYGRPLLGETIRLNGIPFEVIGTLEEKGGGFGNPDDQIIIPLGTARQRLFGRNDLSNIYISAATPEQVSSVEQSIQQVLRRQHRLRTGEDDFRIMSQAEFLGTMQETGRTLTMFLGSIAFVSLLVGGVGIMNIMLVSVAERTREIGIRKAVGAKRSHILVQFLIESILLSVAGGLIGTILGGTTASLLGRTLGWQTVVPLWAVVIAFCFAAFVGVFFGLYPARKAALLDPIECLRYE